MFDNVKFEKEKAIARFNRLHTIMRVRQLIEVAAVFAAISWCSSRAPAIFRSTAASLLDFSTCLSNHHIVFLIGNAIIVMLLMLCRRTDAPAPARRRELYDDYVKYSETARAMPSPPQQGEEVALAAGLGDCDKQIVAVRAEEATASSQCDDAAAVIEKAAKQIRRFQRTQSEVLRREIAVRQGAELRRSETECGMKTVNTDAAGIENLSNEEFRRRVDAFIDKHWSKRATKLDGNEKYQS